ncbi:hypothetical protein [Wohlfahrtiimonas populi]|uniref:hypothetical protein n=1 Tax=Wohlfahrtiimonas populi TaxID=1940240 RepID=UPI001300D524|nr:hypothetical protein [Wohlfahrtiimonas populi]
MIDKSGGGLGFILVLLLIGVGIIVLYSVYCVILHLFCIYQPTIEITETGIRYPYLLHDNPEISWENIKKFEYIEDSDGDSTSYYIVVQLEISIDIGSFRKVPNASLIGIVQKKYDHPILIFFEDIIKDYSLPDLADRLNAECKSLTRSPQFINNEPVLYKKSERSIREIFKKLIVGSIAFLIVPSFFMLRNWNANARLFFIIFGVIVAFMVLKILYDHFFESFQPKVALRFNEQGISIINDQAFAMPIAWKDVQHVELRTQKQSPLLIIEAIDAESREVKSFEIKNDLKDTSVYEVISSLKYYWW